MMQQCLLIKTLRKLFLQDLCLNISFKVWEEKIYKFCWDFMQGSWSLLENMPINKINIIDYMVFKFQSGIRRENCQVENFFHSWRLEGKVMIRIVNYLLNFGWSSFFIEVRSFERFLDCLELQQRAVQYLLVSGGEFTGSFLDQKNENENTQLLWIWMWISFIFIVNYLI